MKKLLCCIAILALCFTGNAQKKGEKWKLIATDTSKAKWLVNTEEVLITKAKTVRIWVRREIFFDSDIGYSADSRNQPKILTHILSLHEFDCTQKRMRILFSIDYAQDNTVIDSSDNRGRWMYIIPDTVGYDLTKFACSNRKRKY